jgi:hypothetical protein
MVYHSQATESFSEHPPRSLTIGRRNRRLVPMHCLGHAPGPLVGPGFPEKISRGGTKKLVWAHEISTRPRTGRSDRLGS